MDFLKIASEKEENQEKLAAVDQIIREVKPSLFGQELIQEQRELLTKSANFWQKAQQGALKGLGAVGIAGASVVGTALVNDMYDVAKKALTKKRNFEGMLNANPDLNDYPADKVKAYFTTLHEKGGPEISGDPHMAGEFVRQHLEFSGRGMIDSVKKIVDIRSQLGKTKDHVSIDFNKFLGGNKPGGHSGSGGGGSGFQRDHENYNPSYSGGFFDQTNALFAK